MGLEGVETILEVQDRCDVEISDEEVAGLRTVGQLSDLVVSLLPRPTSDLCVTRHVFFRLRAALPDSSQLGPRDDVPLPDARRDRRRLWTELEESTGLRLPHPGLFGPKPTSLSELTRSMVSLTLGQLAQDPGAWSENDVWESVKDSVILVSGVEPALVTRDARFVEDLGC